MSGEFEKRNAVVIAIAQEDKDLKSHAKILDGLETGGALEIVADLNREQTTAYERVTTYLIDKDGVVRQVFPMLIHHRATWQAVLNELDQLE